jgi:serine/threonine-protein kinase
VDTTVDLLVGRLLDRRYAVRSRLATGGMATVYEAVDTRLDRLVALKVMHPQLAANPDFVSRFIAEAKSAARLSHPNVVAVFDQGTDGNAVFLVMEHVAGRTLRDLIRARRRLSARQAFDVLEPVLSALSAAHAAGIVHRDVKPENVLLADDGRVKVADFGLARAIAAPSGTTQGVLLGTVAYLSPEQVEPGRADARSDVYAAGILLFELLTGSTPYAGEAPLQVAYRHVHEDVPAPSSRVGGIPVDLDVLVGRATSRDPAGRPVDAAAMLAELVRARRALPRDGDTGDLTHAKPTPSRPTRSHPQDGLTTVVPRPPSGDATMVIAQRRAGSPPPDASAGSVVMQPPMAGPRRRGRRGLLALLLVLLLTAGLSAGAWWLGAGPGAYTSTPSMLEMTRSDAEAAARAAGLGVDFADERFDERIAKGRVLETDPGPGARIRKNATVTVVLSAGPERFAVPALANMSLAQADAALRKANLSRGKITKQFSDEPVNQVLSSAPGPGSKLKRGAAVALVLSKGVEQVAVPSVVGKPFADAEKALVAKGFVVQAEEDFSATVPEGSVIRQTPRKGKVDKGSTVQVWRSKGPPPVPVPNVTNQRLDQARATLERAGFEVEVDNLISGPDIVLDQDPNGGTTAPRGSTIRLSVF